MYDIQLEINGKKLSMNPGSGYYISTISGLTGVTANLELSQSNSGIGESFSGGSRFLMVRPTNNKRCLILSFRSAPARSRCTKKATK